MMLMEGLVIMSESTYNVLVAEVYRPPSTVIGCEEAETVVRDLHARQIISNDTFLYYCDFENTVYRILHHGGAFQGVDTLNSKDAEIVMDSLQIKRDVARYRKANPRPANR